MRTTIGAAVMAVAAAACVPEGHLRAPAQEARPSSFERLRREGRVWGVEELAARLRADHGRGQPVVAVARTVLRGVEPVEVRVELLDVMYDWLYPQHHLVLGKIVDENPAVVRAGVVAGMSGSPILLEGRVVGALAYALGEFGKVPFIGITPIEYMLRDADRPREEFSRSPPPLGSGWRAVPTPLLVAGGSPRGARILEELLRAMGRADELIAVPAPQGSALWDPPERLVEGGSVGVMLLGGDASLTGVGTVTLVDGNRVLAFGHPMLGDGPSDLPMVSAVVHEIFAGLALSYKITSPGRVVGALVEDRTSGIAGEIGATPRMVPLEVVVSSQAGGERRLRFEVARSRRWFALLVDWAVSSAAEAYEPWGHDRVVVTRTTVRLADGRTAQWEETQAVGGAGGLPLARILTGGSPLARLVNNEFEAPQIASIEVRQEFVPGTRTARIHRLWPLRPEVEPGGTARIRVQLRPWRAPDEFVDVEVPVPPEARPGSPWKITIGGGNEVAMELPPPDSLDGLLAILGRAHPATALVAVTELESFKLLYRGRELDRLPASVVAQMAPGLEEQAVLARTSLRTLRETRWVVRGRGEVTVRIREGP